MDRVDQTVQRLDADGALDARDDATWDDTRHTQLIDPVGLSLTSGR